MRLYLASLNSGSNGNCYYIGNGQEGILVDAGITCKEIEKRLQRLGIHITSIRALIITHEHSDHIRGVASLSKKYSLPIFISSPTYAHASLSLSQDLVKHFEIGQNFSIGNFLVTTFSKQHDAVDPCAVMIRHGDICVGIFTDLGAACTEVVYHFKKCHAVLLEANYDEEMLERGPYPYFLKQRIRSNYGHLSNRQALELLQNYSASHLSHIFLGHLSKTNNRPELVETYFRTGLPGMNITVASRYQESELIEIRQSPPVDVSQRANRLKSFTPVQLTLFGP